MTRKSQKTILKSDDSAVRLDKWLWAARFYKTRALAQEMVQGGKVQYNGQRCKSSRLVECDATITLWQGLDEKEIKVLGLTSKRLGAPLAEALYQETEQSLQKRTAHAQQRRLLSQGANKPQRPDKKQRRQITRFKTQDLS